MSGSEATRFLYAGLDMIAMYDGAGAMRGRFVHGREVDEPLVWYVGSGTGFTKPQSFLTSLVRTGATAGPELQGA